VLQGRKVLGIIDGQLGEARQRLQALSQLQQRSAEAVARNREAQAQAIRRLAASRLDAVRQAEIGARLDGLEQRAKSILDERDRAIATLEQRLDQARRLLEDEETRRAAIHDEVDVAARRLAECEAAAQEALEGDPEFTTQLETTEKFQAIAVSAEEKAQTALDDRRDKGKPYESDELFMYLWRRHYGTSEYRANPLARLLDGWVARLCRYNDARPNYWMLLEIPKRLQLHADRAQEEADKEVEKLRAIEQRAASAAGVPEAAAALEEAEGRQDQADARIAQAEDAVNVLLAGESEFAAGRDRYLEEAVDVFAEAIERQDVSDLMRAAMATMTVEDDAIVDVIRSLRAEAEDLQQELRQNRQAEREFLRRSNELGEVRRRFKRSRYDDLRSGFKNVDAISRTVTELLAGLAGSGQLWDVIRRNQRYRDVAGERPDFGSGGIVFPRGRMPRRGPVWHWPGSASSRGGGGFRVPRLPSGGPRGRGGFRTGGGF
jgi:chromosome segregation ATPase